MVETQTTDTLENVSVSVTNNFIFTTMNYQDAMQMFRDELLDNKDVLMLSDYYSRTTEDVVKKLMPYIKVKGYRDKSIKSVSINFSDIESRLNVKLMLKL